MKKKLWFVMAAAVIGTAGSANASLVLNGTTSLSGDGFGNDPRLLTLQQTQNNTTESAAIGISGGNLVSLTPGIDDSLVHLGNGVTNAGGDLVQPLTDALKYGSPTLGELNWTTAANVNLLFNAIEPGGNGLSVDDVTLKFYNGDTLIAAIDGQFALDNTVMGNGQAGYWITVDGPQREWLDANVFNQAGVAGFRIALESTISGVAGGPESFSALAPVPEPETYAMMLAGLGILGLARIRRRKEGK
jgi:hypothetical protein